MSYQGYWSFVMEKRKRLARARATYHRRRMRCIAKYRREGRCRRSGALVQAGPAVVRIGAPPFFGANLLPEKTHRITGSMKSEVTGGWVLIMDCDVDGQRIAVPA